MLPLNTNIRLAYANGKDEEQNFIQNLSLFLCTFLKEHGTLIETRLNLRETLMEVSCGSGGELKTMYSDQGIYNRFMICQLDLTVLLQALHYMLLVSEVEETEIFKICLEYWNHLAAELYRESPFSTSTSPLLSGNQHFDVPPRRQLYLPVLSKVPLTDSFLSLNQLKHLQIYCLQSFSHHRSIAGGESHHVLCLLALIHMNKVSVCK